MAYAAWSVVANEQPSASKWNILGTNDASFNDGTGIGNAAILSQHLKPTEGLVQSSATLSLTAVQQDITGATVTFTPIVASVCKVDVFAEVTSNATAVTVNLVVDGVTQTPSMTVQNSGADNMIIAAARPYRLTLSVASHTIKLQAARGAGGSGSISGVSTNGSGFYYKLSSQ